MIAGQAVLIAIGVDWDGRHQVLGVELANRETRSSWRDFPLGPRHRGLAGVVPGSEPPGSRCRRPRRAEGGDP